ncbi:MAG TPA: patatin-like phospholipase family protein [Thermoleophilaceae bacterium]|jgi:NTE family protein|nr:patatin-like phospholipase family protein [Thermoleophilaceae bacterium]
MKVGLVLGAGGVLGGAWLVGGLSALAKETGWDPGSADNIVGTSAGSMIGALVAGGVPPWFMVAHSRGESFEGLLGPDGRPASQADRSAGASFRVHRGLPAIGPGSLRMAFTALSNPLRHTPLQMVAGWVPAGFVSTDSLKEVVTRAVPGDWVEHPSYWAVACDYESGRRTPFGRLGSPRAHIGDAVAASCAIPGFYRPVRINGRRYVDGGVCSVSNMDLMAGRGLDLVICLNPLTSSSEGQRSGSGISGVATGAINGALDFIPSLTRRGSRARLVREETKVRRFGTEVVILEPTPEDHAAMGRNWMNSERRQRVIDTAEETVAAQLRAPAVRKLLEGLPPGEPHKIDRPPGPPSSWPDIQAVARRAA